MFRLTYFFLLRASKVELQRRAENLHVIHVLNYACNLNASADLDWHVLCTYVSPHTVIDVQNLATFSFSVLSPTSRSLHYVIKAFIFFLDKLCWGLKDKQLTSNSHQIH